MNDLMHQMRAPAPFDDQGELHGRSFHLNSSFSTFIERPVDDVGPGHEFFEIRGDKTILLADDGRNELRAGAITRVEELPAGGVMAKVLSVLGAQKRTLMVIEPPREIGMRCVLEIDNRVDVT